MTWKEFLGEGVVVSEGTLQPYTLACKVLRMLRLLDQHGLLKGFKRRYNALDEAMEAGTPAMDDGERDQFYLDMLEGLSNLLEDAAGRHGYSFGTAPGDGACYVLSRIILPENVRHYVLCAYSSWPAGQDEPPFTVQRAGAFASLASAKRAAVRLRDRFGFETAVVEHDDGSTIDRWYLCPDSSKWERHTVVPSYD